MKKVTYEKRARIANDVMNYIYKYIDTNINIDELSLELNISKFHLHRIFKDEFTFERWKQGFHDYQQNIKFTTKLTDELEGVKINDVSIKLNYNMFHFVPFNIRKELNNY